jgi:hypothetical protein
VAVAVLSVLLISSLAFALMLWTGLAAPPKLGVSPGSIDFGTQQVGSQSSQILTLSNSGRQDLNWSADKGKADWLTLDPGQGRIPSGGSQTLNVRADTSLLTAGRYSASISFNSNGGGASVSAVLIVASGPVVSSISPTSGPAIGGTTVTIVGNGFTGANKVLFGTATSTFAVNSDTQITAVSPAGNGTVHVMVITPTGPSATSTADRFTYQIIPKIMSISPTSGPAAGGTTVTIRGEGLTGASQVLFGTVPARSFTVNSATQITAVSPAGSGTVDVMVSTPAGTSATSAADRFTYVPTPAPVPFIQSISPTSGPAAGGTTVTITGTNFNGATKVQFGSTVVSFTLTSATQITVKSPGGSGTVDVRVTTPAGTSAPNSTDRFTYVPTPTVTGISPTAGPIAGKTSVIIRGAGFTGATKVLFGTTAASFRLNSPTQITAVSPAGTAGTVDVKVITPGGTSATSIADRFTYWIVLPSITKIDPPSGPVTGETTVTIRGSGFTGASQVKFGTVASSFTVDSDTQIRAFSPGGSGTVDVTVTGPNGTSATNSADRFTYVPAPTVTGISTTAGPLTGGTSVIIRGTGFTGVSQVLFGTTAASFTLNTDKQITTVSPKVTKSGTVDVKVTTPGGTSAISNADRFTYMPAPKIVSISPSSGPASGGTPVTITGTDFNGATKVQFGPQEITFNLDSTTQITVTSPAGSGTVDVRVTTPGGISKISPEAKFTYEVAQVIPNPLDFGTIEQGNTKTMGVTIKNISGQPLNWNVVAASLPTWLAVSPASGTGLQPGNQQPIDVMAITANLESQPYSATLTFTSPQGNASLDVKLTVKPMSAPKLVVTPTSLKFEVVIGGNQTLKETISNGGDLPLNWKVDPDSLPAWLTMSATSGNGVQPGPAKAQHIIVTADTKGLTAGTYNATLTFTSPNGGGTVDVSVTIKVSP